MDTYQSGKNRLSSAVGRWAGIGPYYAMFPMSFAFSVINTYSKPGNAVLDPFAGRASSIYAAAASERYGYGIEINPVGWLYGQIKLKPAAQSNVLRRIGEIEELAKNIAKSEIDSLPEFFSFCYTPEVLKYLLAMRKHLRWRDSIVDGTLMSILLVYLHGDAKKSLSNQTRQGKAMSPEYSINWWKARNLRPPEINPSTFMTQKVLWRYKEGKPQFTSKVYLGDSTRKLSHLKNLKKDQKPLRFDLLFTSPPYCGVTSYHYDQWLRLWMLGGNVLPSKGGEQANTDFANKAQYRTLLETIFTKSAAVMNEDAIVYVRTDARAFTFETTLEILRSAFPEKCVQVIDRPLEKTSQTALFGDATSKPGEKDIILRPKQA